MSLNSVLRTGSHALMLTASGAVQPVYQAQSGADPMHFAIALSALRLVHDGERQRLHRCSNARCVLLFYDTTKSAHAALVQPGLHGSRPVSEALSRGKTR